MTNMSNMTTIENITNSFGNNFSNILDSYKNIIIQYINYQYVYLHIGIEVDINYLLYTFYSSFIWSIILSSFIILNTKYTFIGKNKYILIDVFSILGALVGFFAYGSYMFINLNIISGIIINILYLILRKYKILTIFIINYIIYTSVGTASIMVGCFILKNHILYHMNL